MKALSLATLVATACAAVICVAAPHAQNIGQTGARPPVTKAAAIAHFVGRAPFEGDPGGPAPIDILIERWSTDKERDDLAASFTKSGPDGLLTGLQGIRRRTGVLLHPGVQGAGARVRLRHPVNLLFAREVSTPKGRTVVFASDHVLALGKPAADWPEASEFSLLEVRIDADGKGEGKVAAAKEVAYNKTSKAFEIQNYASQPARLVDVRAEKSTKP